MIGRAAKTWWWFLTTLLLLAVWLTATGYIWLHGVPISLLEALASGRGLIAQNEASGLLDGTPLLGQIPGDALAWSSFTIAGLNSLAAVVLLGATYWAWRNPIGPALAVATAFFGAETMWVKSLLPQESLLHLLLACFLAALVTGSVPFMTGIVLALALLSPGQAIMAYLALCYLSYRRQPAYGLLVPTLALFGVGCLLIPLAGDYRLSPGFTGWHILSLLPLVVCLFPSPLRSARGGIYASLLLGSWLTGEAELASILVLGDLVFLALQQCSQETDSDTAEEGFVRWPAQTLLGLAATVALVNISLPGERFLNSRVLIPAQKSKVPLVRLFTTFSLDHHAKRFAKDSWRALVPFPHLSEADYELALDLRPKELPNGFCLLTLDTPVESRQSALLYALLSGQKLGGWDDSEFLAAPLLLCKSRGQNHLHQGPAVIFREQSMARLTENPPLPKQLALLDFRSLLALPHRLQEVSRENGAAYRWKGDNESYTVVFPEGKAEVLLSSRPGEYRISSLAEQGAVRRIDVPVAKWELSGLNLEETLPSRSLIPLHLSLTNRGEGPIGSEMIASWQVETEDASFSPFRQESSKPFILFPGESTELEFFLATPEPEGRYQVKIQALTPEGKAIEVPLVEPAELRTWRRMPAVGTWVEEP